MENLHVILSELKVNSNCISYETKEVEYLFNKLSESIESHEESINEIQNITQEIVNIKQEEQNLVKQIKDQENEFYLTMEKLENLQIEYENLSGLDEYKFEAFKSLNDLEYQLKIFGFNIETLFLEPTITKVKILFSEENIVIFNYDLIENIFDLQKIEPHHRHFEEIRLFLMESGDIEGFLYFVRNFFRKNK